MKAFLQKADDDEFDLPVRFTHVDRNPIWPASTSDRNVIFMGGDAYGILGTKD